MDNEINKYFRDGKFPKSPTTRAEAEAVIKGMALVVPMHILLEQLQEAARTIEVLREMSPQDSKHGKMIDDLYRSLRAMLHNQIVPLHEYVTEKGRSLHVGDND